MDDINTHISRSEVKVSVWTNWKSTSAFILFIGVYIYSVIHGSSDDVVETTGFVALSSSLFMMFRSQITADMLNTLISNISSKEKK